MSCRTGRLQRVVILLAALMTPPANAGYWSAHGDEVQYSSPLAACLASAENAWGGPRTVHSVYFTYASEGQLTGVACPTRPQPGACFTADVECREGLATLKCGAGEWRSPNGCVSPPRAPLGRAGCESAADGGSLPEVGNPIHLISGNKFHQEVDFRHSGHRRLASVRSYNSQVTWYSAEAASSGRFGSIWRSSFDRRLHTVVDWNFERTSFTVHWVFAVRPDGEELAFLYSSSDETFDPMYWHRDRNRWVRGRKGVHRHLHLVGDELELVTSEGTRERYSLGGRLLWIEYLDGYRLTLEYDDAGRNTAVTDSFGNAIQFNYGEDGLVRAMTDSDGRTTRYTYRYAGFDEDLHGEEYEATRHFNHVIETVVYPDETPEDDTDNPVKRYLYEDARFPWALTGIVDENGNRFATYAYDEEGRAISSEHAGGDGRVTVAYDDVSDTRTVANALGKEAVYHLAPFQGRLRVTEIEGRPSAHCSAADSTYEYDDQGFLERLTNGEGELTTYVHDDRGRELSRTEGVGTPHERTITTEWHESLRLPLSITGPERRIDLTYDGSGRLTERTETDLTEHTEPYATSGETRTWTYGYTAEGLLDTIDGPLPGEVDTRSLEYDPAGNLQSVTDALGHVTEILEVDGAGRPLSVRDPNGVVTDLSYDSRGRLLAVTLDADAADGGSITRLRYDAAGNVVSLSRGDGSTVAYAYDAAHRLVRVEAENGERIEVARNRLGDPTRLEVLDSNGLLASSWERTYDELGRLLEAVGGDQGATLFAYDRTDRLTEVTDPLGRTYSFSYDGLGRLLAETDPEGFDTAYAYTGSDDLASLTDPRSLTTSYVRNGFGEVIRRTSPDTGTTDFWRDAGGRVIRRVDARGVETLYGYDALGRLLSETYPASPGETVIYGYDDPEALHGIGRLTSIEDEAGTTELDYDPRGNLVRRARTLGDATYETLIAYDAADRVTEMGYPTGRIVAYERDGQGRVTSITTQAHAGAPEVDVATGIAYEPFGPPTGATFGNGSELELGHDLDGRVETIRVAGPGGTVLDRTLTYDAAGNPTGITDHRDPSRSESFAYDALDRLTAATGPYGSIAYTYDSSGNRLTRTLQTSGGTEEEIHTIGEGSNRLLGIEGGGEDSEVIFSDDFGSGDLSCWSRVVGGEEGSGTCPSDPSGSRTFTYSANGNTVSDAGSGEVGLIFIYDQGNRLKRVLRGGALVASYLYDASERRVAKTLAGGPTVHYHHARDGRLLAETTGTGAVIREYLWLGDMPVAMTVPDGGGGRALVYLHADHLNRPVVATGADGAVAWEGVFRPFGAVHEEDGTIDQPLRFPGQVEDEETGLYQNWQRSYDPTTGRYSRTDPIFDIMIHVGLGKYEAHVEGRAESPLSNKSVSPLQGTDPNLYRYAQGNPLAYIDPDGLNALALVGGICAVGGIYVAIENIFETDRLVNESPIKDQKDACQQAIADRLSGGRTDIQACETLNENIPGHAAKGLEQLSDMPHMSPNPPFPPPVRK